jgi:hypothetical protein
MSAERAQTEATPRQAAPAARPLRTTDARAISVTGLLALQRTAGNRAVTRLLQRSNGHPPNDWWERVAASLERRMEQVEQEIADVERIAEDHLGGRWVPGDPVREQTMIKALEELAQRGDTTAAGLLSQLRRLHRRHRRLFEHWDRARARLRARVPGGGGQGGAPGGGGGQSQFDKDVKAGEKAAVKEAEKTVVKEAEKTVVKEAEKTVVKTAEKTAVKTAEAAAERAVGTLAKAEGRLARTIYKIGAIAEALLPGPLDALMLMVDYAGAWADAKEEAQRRSFHYGFELGLAAGLIGLQKPWVHANLRRRFADKDAISELIGVTGLRELETNKGLDLGVAVGAAFPAKERGELLEAGFGELAKDGARIADRREIFTIETVARLSRVLRPWSESVFDEVARFVQAIGDSTTYHTIAGGRGPHSQQTTTRTRAVWFNVTPGIRRLELLKEGSTSMDYRKISDIFHLETIPDRVAAMAIRRTEQLFGKVEEMDGPLMPPRREPIAAKPRRQPIAAGR